MIVNVDIDVLSVCLSVHADVTVWGSCCACVISLTMVAVRAV